VVRGVTGIGTGNRRKVRRRAWWGRGSSPLAAIDLDLLGLPLGGGQHHVADDPLFPPATYRSVLPVSDARQERRDERHEPQYRAEPQSESRHGLHLRGRSVVTSTLTKVRGNETALSTRRGWRNARVVTAPWLPVRRAVSG
jgi:hypothetical protein